AKWVFMESLKRPDPPPVVPPNLSHPSQAALECLERCMDRLPLDERVLILEYYQDEKRAKIDHRQELAERFHLTSNALRLKVGRIRKGLHACIDECLKQKRSP